MSNLKLKADVRSFEDAEEFLGARASKVLGHNTVIHRLGEDHIAVKYHRTDIVTFARGGGISIYVGQWHTVTTANRLHLLTPHGWRFNRTGGWIRLNGTALTAGRAHILPNGCEARVEWADTTLTVTREKIG